MDLEKLPANFNWKHYATLHPWFQLTTEEASARHYLVYGYQGGYTYNYANLDVLVYSTGKTGSSTLMMSFKTIGKNATTMHEDSKLPSVDRIVDIINYPRVQKLLVVTSYREPISQYLSLLFQNIPYHLSMPVAQILQHNIEWVNQQAVKFVAQSITSHYECPFSVNQMKNYDGANIYKSEFNKDLGFVTLETERLNILVLVFEKIQNWTSIIQNNTRYKNFEMKLSNITSGKDIGKLYKDVQSTIVIPKQVLDTIYKREELNMKYFYTPEEVVNIKKRWYDRLP